MTFEKALTCSAVVLLAAGIVGCGDEQGPLADGTANVADRSGSDVSQTTPEISHDAAEIRKLIPQASAMAWPDMQKLVTSPTPPKEADVEEKSLTLLLFTLASASSQRASNSEKAERIENASTARDLPVPADPSTEPPLAESQVPALANDAREEQFQFLSPRIPKPARLAQEVCRGVGQGDNFVPQGPITFLHADRITDCSCEVNGDTAKGTVSFEVPDLYRGKVDYVAERKDDAWRIHEFVMSAYGIHIVRNAEGRWEKK